MQDLVYDLKLKRGSTLRLTFTWLDGSGTPVNLTDSTANLSVKRTVEDADKVLELTTENGGLILYGATGRIELCITAEQSAHLEYPYYAYDLNIYFPNSDSVPYYEGLLIVTPSAIV